MSDKQAVLDDDELIARCLDGHRSAFDDLVSRYHRQIYNMVYRMLGSVEDAADVTQDTFLRAYRWQYIVSGVQNPRFTQVLGSLITEEQAQRIGNALAPIVH